MIKRSKLPKVCTDYFAERWGRKTFTSFRRILFRYFNEETQNIPEFLFTHYANRSVWYKVSKEAAVDIPGALWDFMDEVGVFTTDEMMLSYYQMNSLWDVKPKATYSFTWERPAGLKQWYKKWHKKVRHKSYNIKVYRFINYEGGKRKDKGHNAKLRKK